VGTASLAAAYGAGQLVLAVDQPHDECLDDGGCFPDLHPLLAAVVAAVLVLTIAAPLLAVAVRLARPWVHVLPAGVLLAWACAAGTSSSPPPTTAAAALFGGFALLNGVVAVVAAARPAAAPRPAAATRA
jgi:hypothetical protein